MTTTLETMMPVYHFHERHSRWIAAEPTQVWDALSTLTLDQLTLTRPLVAIRYLGRRAAQPGKPLFTAGPVRMLEITPRPTRSAARSPAPGSSSDRSAATSIL